MGAWEALWCEIHTHLVLSPAASWTKGDRDRIWESQTFGIRLLRLPIPPSLLESPSSPWSSSSPLAFFTFLGTCIGSNSVMFGMLVWGRGRGRAALYIQGGWYFRNSSVCSSVLILIRNPFHFIVLIIYKGLAFIKLSWLMMLETLQSLWSPQMWPSWDLSPFPRTHNFSPLECCDLSSLGSRKRRLFVNCIFVSSSILVLERGIWLHDQSYWFSWSMQVLLIDEWLWWVPFWCNSGVFFQFDRFWFMSIHYSSLSPFDMKPIWTSLACVTLSHAQQWR